MASRRNNDRSDAHDGGDGNGGFSLNPLSPSLGPTALAQRLYISQSQAPKRIKLDSSRQERKLEGEKLVSFSPSGGSHEETGVAVPGLLPRPSQSSLKCRMSSHGLTPELLNLIQPVALEFEQETTEVEEAVSMEWQILPCLKASIPGHVRESLLQTNPGSLHSKASLQVGPFPKVSGVITPHPGPIAIATTASHTSQPLKPPGIPAVSGWKHKTKIEKPHSFEKHDIMSWKSKRGSFAKTTSEADSCDYQWMAFLKLLREQPDYPEFIYLQPSAVRFSAFDPYDLEIVQRCEISSLYYYTMSSKGVTLFKGLDAGVMKIRPKYQR